ncbi:NfeD family protein [Photobacterium carnosum]|uniref:NfeD family protein n=1 Tax=Photobacterium carnosum TaxID=2023717 RepID=UPI001E3319CC|nr:activity regulator of membrane protease YbbK [Photobacterium carnosum]MCD9528515.1 activity regulator of membrane protease YbbK [Photobacterium carnosum]
MISNGFISSSDIIIIVGILLIIVDILVFGLSTVVLFSLGISAIIIGAISNFWLPMAVQTLIGLSTITSVLLIILLWKPLKKFQNISPPQQNVISDFVGLKFILESEVSINTSSSIQYSGIPWKLKLASSNSCLTVLPIGTLVVVTAVDVGLFFIVKVTN